MSKEKVIAIDGPAGSGKSTTAKMVAKEMGFSFLDTGAMYRALTHYALTNNISPSDSEQLTRLAEELVLEFKPTDGVNHVIYDSVDITKEIRTPEVTLHVSEVSAHPGVRKAMVARQKEFGKIGSIVAEGRDTTTVVFPNAAVKIFLIASVEERAKRRLLDLKNAGSDSTVEDQKADLERRDHYDSNREHSPLTKADDAFEIDTTNLTIEEQVSKIVELAKKVFDEN